MITFTELRAKVDAMRAEVEPFRHECEVRHVARMASNADRRRYLEGGKDANGRDVKGVRHHRGDAACERLRNDVARLMGIIK